MGEEKLYIVYLKFEGDEAYDKYGNWRNLSYIAAAHKRYGPRAGCFNKKIVGVKCKEILERRNDGSHVLGPAFELSERDMRRLSRDYK
jgi:hypothetical protein